MIPCTPTPLRRGVRPGEAVPLPVASVALVLPPRKVIQIVATNCWLGALCDDGSMWGRLNDEAWVRIYDVPQPGDER